jgi:single-strand DNA-binding protein
MNKCIFTGRFANDPEIRTTQNGTAQCSFRIAVQRRFKDASGERKADFIQCVAWRNTAEFIHKFFHKGDEAKVVGSLQTRDYKAQDGSTRYVTEIIVEEFEGSSKESAQGKQNAPEGQGFEPVEDDNLPF